MPSRGPLGVIRPFAKQQLEVNFTDKTVEFVIRGPFGVKRRFAHPNPGVTDEEVAICMQGQSSNKFIKGLIDSGLRPNDPEKAREWQRQYCEGTLESLKEEADEQVFPIPEDLQEPLRRALEGPIDVEPTEVETVSE